MRWRYWWLPRDIRETLTEFEVVLLEMQAEQRRMDEILKRLIKENNRLGG